MELVLSRRAKLCKSFPVEQLRIAGVTFEGRQAAISQLQKGQSAAFTQDPDNIYDSNAVAVTTLDGVSLGFVPKDRNKPFVHGTCFGTVQYVGCRGDDGNWGCIVNVQPQVPGVVVLPISENLVNLTRISELFLDEENDDVAEQWKKVRAQILKRSEDPDGVEGPLCSVSGAPTVAVAERWEVQTGKKVLKLRGFATEAPEITRIAHMLENRELLLDELQTMNNWALSDLDVYMKHILQLAEQEEGWTLDLGVLKTYGLEVPRKLIELGVVV